MLEKAVVLKTVELWMAGIAKILFGTLLKFFIVRGSDETLTPVSCHATTCCCTLEISFGSISHNPLVVGSSPTRPTIRILQVTLLFAAR